MKAAAKGAPLSRRKVVMGMSLGGSLGLFGCGGSPSPTAGKGSDTGDGGEGGTTNGGTSTGGFAWPWSGHSETAALPAVADFVSVVASDSLTYQFHETTDSITDDPVTGIQTDTTTEAVLQPYLMSRYQVTNEQWKAFCNEKGATFYPSPAAVEGQYWHGGKYPAGKERHPVLYVSYTQAVAFCEWLGTKLGGYIFYVPTEAEWEYAALGSGEGYQYPWGLNAEVSWSAASEVLSTRFNCNTVCASFLLSHKDDFRTLTYTEDSVITLLPGGSTALQDDTAVLESIISITESGLVVGWQYDSETNATWADFVGSDAYKDLVNVWGGYTTEVGSVTEGRSWCGCEDMAGNVYEWTSTRNVASNGLEAGVHAQCVKGGSWYSVPTSGKSTGRGEGRDPSGAYHSVGFRVAARLR